MTANWHPRLGVIGFSLGAAFAVALAQERTVDAVVLYYGLGEFKLDRWSAPVLGHFAEVDEWEPAEDARTAFAGLRDAGIHAELHIYPETGHWFANRAVGDAYNADAARVAKDRTFAFLRRELA
jgi:carboxymethylenebutenolidase